MMASSILIFNLFNCNFSLHNLYVDISLFDRESQEFNLMQNKEMIWVECRDLIGPYETRRVYERVILTKALDFIQLRYID